MRIITVPVVDKPESVVALLAAFDLANKLNANVHGYHVIRHDSSSTAGIETIPFRIYNDSDSKKQPNLDELKKVSVNAESLFMRMVEENGFTFTKKARFEPDGGLAMWHELKGSPEKFFAIAGPLSDLITVTRPEKRSSLRAQAFMLSALLYSGRPVLILPKQKPPELGKNILIAWNQSMEAAGVISACLPLLQYAEKVNVITAGGEYRAGPKVLHLKQYLKQWDIKVNHVKTLGDNVENEIVDAFRETGSDLLMMGAYSRNHWREKIFGGMTNHILYNTSIPTVMLHR